MVYTITFQPSIDLFYRLPGVLSPGDIHRAGSQWLRPGGKGLNVAIVLTRLGIPAKALCFAAGQTGRLFRTLAQDCCDAVFLELPEGETRINAKIEADTETAVNAPGEKLREADLQALASALSGLAPEDVLVLSGRMEAAQVTRFGTLCRKKGAKLVVDSSDAALAAALPLHPWLIKPNAEELAALLGEAVPDRKNASAWMAKAQAMGAENVLLSMGADGAMLLTADGRVYAANAPVCDKIMSTVGAGDSMLAGFLAAKQNGMDNAEALAFTVAAGSASVCGQWLAEKETIFDLRKRVSVCAL